MDNHPLARRSFLQNSTTAALAASHALLATRAFAAGSDTLRLGLVGCGGRGGGAVLDALHADPAVQLVAMGDVFEDQLQNRLKGLQVEAGSRVNVPAKRQFVGFDAYRHVIDAVDVVILATSPHFRPLHLQYAVDRGIHVFVEKPVATDAPGVRKCLAACEQARQKNLSIVSGLCWRYHEPRRAAMQQVAQGAIGEVTAVETVYNAQGVWNPRRTREQCQSEMEYQLRNWYYYTWLSGDHIVEQAVHALDTMSWAMGDEAPEKCWGVGGRQVRTAPRYGNIYDHFSLVYEYPQGVRGYHQCRHWPNTPSRVRDLLLGSEGTCDVFGHKISGTTDWKYSGRDNNKYQAEHEALFAAIREATPVNDGHYMCRSTMLAIMGRMAAYTGNVITWQMATESEEDLSPPSYEWTEVPRRPVARPGTTPFV